MQSKAATVEEYLAELPAERREAIARVRQVILDNLPDGYVEGMQWGMITYAIPLARFPDTYNGQPLGLAALASQKRHMAVYLMGVHGARDEAFREAYRATGKRLDMAKSCVRFRSLDDLPLELIGQTIASVSVDELIGLHEAAHARR